MRHHTQHIVPHVVAMGVVHGLEPVYVGEEQAEFPLVTAQLVEGVVKGHFRVTPVAHFRDRANQCQFLQLFNALQGSYLRRDVAEYLDGPDDLIECIENGANAHENGDEIARSVPDIQFALARLSVAKAQLHGGRAIEHRVPRVVHVTEKGAGAREVDHLLAGKSRYPLRAPVPVSEDCVGVDEEHAVIQLVQQILVRDVLAQHSHYLA